MYTSHKTFTIRCATGSTGSDVTQGATAESIISQRDADVKALGLATRLAYEFLVCTLPPDPETPIFCSLPISGYASATAGHVPEVFRVDLGACAVYSTVSQADADAAAAIAAQVQANQKRDVEQRLIFYSAEQSYTDACNAVLGPDFGPNTVTITKAAGTYTSNTSQPEADYSAWHAAKLEVLALIASTCIPLFHSAAVSYTAHCTGGGMVGADVTVAFAPGTYTSAVSQAAADAAALAAATAQATAALVCIAGFYNIAEAATATCVTRYGADWVGADVTVTTPAGAYFDTTQVAANSLAESAALLAAEKLLVCSWTGILPP